MGSVTKAEIKKYWGKNICAGKWDTVEEQIRGVEEYRYKVHPWLPEILGFSNYKKKKVLEIGCGQGVDLSRFAENGAYVTGIDITEEGIKLAKKRFDFLGLEGSFIVGDIENLPFSDNYFDMVYSHGVLHHTLHTQKVVDEIYRVLKRGGKCVVMIYHKYSLHNFYRCIGRLEYWYLKKKRREDEWLRKARSMAELNIEGNISGYGGHPTSQSREFLRTNVNEDIHCPLTKTYSHRGAKKLFEKFSNVSVDCFNFHPPKLSLHSPLSIVLSSIYKVLNLFLSDEKISKMFGWNLFIEASKPTK